MTEALPCGHALFHPRCIRVWLQRQPRCPVCRANIREFRRPAPGTAPGTAPATPHLPLRKAAAEPVDDEDDERRRVLEHVFGTPGSATNSSHRVASR